MRRLLVVCIVALCWDAAVATRFEGVRHLRTRHDNSSARSHPVRRHTDRTLFSWDLTPAKHSSSDATDAEKAPPPLRSEAKENIHPTSGGGGKHVDGTPLVGGNTKRRPDDAPRPTRHRLNKKKRDRERLGGGPITTGPNGPHRLNKKKRNRTRLVISPITTGLNATAGPNAIVGPNLTSPERKRKNNRDKTNAGKKNKRDKTKIKGEGKKKKKNKNKKKKKIETNAIDIKEDRKKVPGSLAHVLERDVPKDKRLNSTTGLKTRSTLLGGQGSNLTVGEGLKTHAPHSRGQGFNLTLGEILKSQTPHSGGQGWNHTVGESLKSHSPHSRGQGSNLTVGEGLKTHATLPDGQGSNLALGESLKSQTPHSRGEGSNLTLGEGLKSQIPHSSGQGSNLTLAEGQKVQGSKLESMKQILERKRKQDLERMVKFNDRIKEYTKTPFFDVGTNNNSLSAHPNNSTDNNPNKSTDNQSPSSHLYNNTGSGSNHTHPKVRRPEDNEQSIRVQVQGSRHGTESTPDDADPETSNTLPGTFDLPLVDDTEDNQVPVFAPLPPAPERVKVCSDHARAGCEHFCLEVKGRPTCGCYRGFRLSGRKCHDVDECSVGNGGCERGCVNTLGSHHCSCPAGLRLSDNDKTCIDVNECLLRNGHGPCQDTCTNTWGGYTCTCRGLPGTRLSSNNHTCDDLDECSKNNAGCSHTCLNTLGNAFCLCPPGYMLGDDWRTCHDIDECATAELPDELCPVRCVNTVGSYHCAELPECPPGFEHGPAGCEDVDECQDTELCSQQCVNTDGSFHCSCKVGFMLGADKRTCKEVTLDAVCPPLDTPPHGYVVCTRLSLKTGPWRHRVVNHSGSICELHCPVGYRNTGLYRRFCGQSGTWLGPSYGSCERHPSRNY